MVDISMDEQGLKVNIKYYQMVSGRSLQGGALPVINWFVIPMNTIDISAINRSEIGVRNQTSYLGGTTL